MKQRVTKVQYFTKEALIEANKEAVDNCYNRGLNDSFLETLDESNKYPVSAVFEHDHHARIKVVLDAMGLEAWLDISWERLRELPAVWCNAPEVYSN